MIEHRTSTPPTAKTRPDPAAALRSPWAYFAAVLTWSWGFWTLSIVLGHGVTTAVGTAFALMGLLGPMVGGIGFTYLTRDAEGRRDYWARLLRPGRIPAPWLAVALLLAPVLMVLAAGLDVLFGGSLAPYRETAAPFLARPAMLLPFALNVFFVGPLPEEFGWRGYVLDRLQERFGALRSSLVLGVVWAAWHLPLFLMEGTYQYLQGLGSLWFWLFLIGILPLTVVFTWVYNNTRRSTLAIVLLHFTRGARGRLPQRLRRHQHPLHRAVDRAGGDRVWGVGPGDPAPTPHERSCARRCAGPAPRLRRAVPGGAHPRGRQAAGPLGARRLVVSSRRGLRAWAMERRGGLLRVNAAAAVARGRTA